MNRPSTPRGFNKLTGARLLEYYKIAQYVYYRINHDTFCEFPFIKEIIEEHASKMKCCAADYEGLVRYKKSGSTCDELKAGKICFNDI